MTIYQPYFYIIGWSELDRWYVGCRFSQSKTHGIAHPSELMVTYFTSSKNHVHPFIEQHGLPDVKWTFPCKTAQQAKDGEQRIMDEFHNFLPDERWINRGNNGAIYQPTLSEAHKKKLSLVRKGKAKSTEHKAKLSAAMKGKPSRSKGVPRDEETKRKISATKLGRKFSEEHRRKLSEARKGKSNSPESNAKRSATLLARYRKD